MHISAADDHNHAAKSHKASYYLTFPATQHYSLLVNQGACVPGGMCPGGALVQGGDCPDTQQRSPRCDIHFLAELKNDATKGQNTKPSCPADLG